ncbi:MAG: glycosyltransferase family 2 protein [Parabacteroides sp.]|nr:glycosyltransferase family 2 protein [Parabacteroides sp.]
METLVACIVLVFTGIQLTVALVNLLAGETLLPAPGRKPPSVFVLIPARNEARTIGSLLADLSRSAVRPLEIIVCDDRSDDGTARVVKETGRMLGLPVRLIRSLPLPDGWTGKNFACFQLARQASGVYFLFLDADVRIGREAIARALVTARRNRLGLLSVFPCQRLKTWGEKSVVPLMGYILLTLLPLRAVRKAAGQPALAAANGQFMLFRSDTYRRLQPHRNVRNTPVEDIRIARYYKSRGILTGCYTGNSGVSCRMYRNFREAVNGFARSLPAFFGGSRLLAGLFWLITTFGFITVWNTFDWPITAGYIAAYLLARLIANRIACRPLTEGLVYIPLQQIAFAWILLRSLAPPVWKGRKVTGGAPGRTTRQTGRCGPEQIAAQEPAV